MKLVFLYLVKTKLNFLLIFFCNKKIDLRKNNLNPKLILIEKIYLPIFRKLYINILKILQNV